MLNDLFINIAIVVSFLFVAGQILKRYSLENEANIKVKIAIGGIFAIMGCVLMIFTIRATDIVIVDLRNIAVISSAIFGGPIAVAITALAVGIFRIAYFGVNNASIVAFIVALLIGAVCIMISRTSFSRFKRFFMMFFVAMFFSNIALIYLLKDSSHLSEIIRYYWLVHIFGVALGYYTCEYIILNNKIFKEMSYYQMMADNLLDMITIHKFNGIYKYASPSSTQLLGKSPKEMIGQDIFDIIHPEDRENILEIQTGLRDNIFSEYTQDLRLKHNNGDYIWVESTFKSIKNSDDEIQEIICATRDISERKRIENKLREQREQAIEANRLKSQFLANMSHELRTPLNSIIGFTTRVIKKSESTLDQMQLDNLEIVKEEGKHLLVLINDLLDYSKIESGKMDVSFESFDLESVINEAYNMTKGIMEEKNLQFKIIYDEADQYTINSDRIKFKQILVNLLSNAFKYSETGLIKLEICQEGHFYKINVMDQGIGIEEEHLSHIFNEFHQVDGSYTRKVGGTGLGLAITKKFIEMLGGKIEVTSTIGEGSCFTLYLPKDYEQKDQMKSFIDTSNTIDHTKYKVAFIEDDLSTRRLYHQYLEEAGFLPVVVDEERDIIEEIIKIQPVAIILDIILRKKDGWQILNALKENMMTKNIPVIMASALNEKKIAFQLQVDDYLVKPIMQEDLISAIDKVLSHRQDIEVLFVDDDEIINESIIEKRGGEKDE